MYVLSEPSQFTPKGSEELELAHAGLGKRMLSIPDNLKHDEVYTRWHDIVYNIVEWVMIKNVNHLQNSE